MQDVIAFLHNMKFLFQSVTSKDHQQNISVYLLHFALMKFGIISIKIFLFGMIKPCHIAILIWISFYQNETEHFHMCVCVFAS
jgi:hypothetical protein